MLYSLKLTTLSNAYAESKCYLSCVFTFSFVSQAQNDIQSEAVETSYWERAKQVIEDVKTGDRSITEGTKNWVVDDVKKIGDWQNRVVKVEVSDPKAIEERLNSLGEERWECFFVERVEGHLMFYFKKSRISYLNKASKGDFGKLISRGDSE